MAAGSSRKGLETEAIRLRKTLHEGSSFKNLWRKLWCRLTDPSDTRAAILVAMVLLCLETVLCFGIVLRVPYTKIDWDAYMSQVEGFLSGERDYSKLEGDTGPLVYPTGFLYVFTALRYLTNGTVSVAQLYFIGIYVLNQAIVFFIYIRGKLVPPWALILLCLSKRVHSIFILRLFNDCIAMLFLHTSILILQSGWWNVGLTLFSAAVSVKMNVLLFAPSLLLILLKATSLLRVFLALSCAAILQLLVGFPFLLHYPWAYLSRSFNLGRVFIHFWSVNFKFVPEAVFVSKPFALSLLFLHLLILFLFVKYHWCRAEGGILLSIGWKPLSNVKGKSTKRHLTARGIASIMFIGNFIGIVFARSLHYQFFSWYFHALPCLLWSTDFPTPVRLVLWLFIEVCWNVFPSTSTSSLVLLASHVALLGGLWAKRPFSQKGKKGE